MTLLIELDSDNRASLRRLFDRYPCLHGSVAAVIEGGMGRVFTDAQEEPSVALAVLDFHFLAGDPLHPNALLLFKLLQPGDAKAGMRGARFVVVTKKPRSQRPSQIRRRCRRDHLPHHSPRPRNPNRRRLL
jgi:hypothetical protein